MAFELREDPVQPEASAIRAVTAVLPNEPLTRRSRVRLIRLVWSLSAVAVLAGACATAGSSGMSRSTGDASGYSRPSPSDSFVGPCRDAVDPSYVVRDCW